MTVLYVTAAAQPRQIIRTFLNYSVDTVTALHPWSPLGFTVIRKSLYDMEKLNKKAAYLLAIDTLVILRNIAYI